MYLPSVGIVGGEVYDVITLIVFQQVSVIFDRVVYHRTSLVFIQNTHLLLQRPENSPIYGTGHFQSIVPTKFNLDVNHFPTSRTKNWSDLSKLVGHGPPRVDILV